MPTTLLTLRHTYEVDATPPKPDGSICYQPELQESFLPVPRMASLLAPELPAPDDDPAPTYLKRRKSQVTVGLIGGAFPTGGAGRELSSGVAGDCRLDGGGAPDGDCSCVEMPPEDQPFAPAWCEFTEDSSGTPGERDCYAMRGGRYVDFTSHFNRRTIDSICRDDYGDALIHFARQATRPCFRLGDVRPARCLPTDPSTCDPDLIEVRRASREEVDQGLPKRLLPRLPEDTTEIPEGGGWYYDALENQICLLGIDRLIGDAYDIFVVHTDLLDFSR